MFDKKETYEARNKKSYQRGLQVADQYFRGNNAVQDLFNKVKDFFK